jgi:hypothetical protein
MIMTDPMITEIVGYIIAIIAGYIAVLKNKESKAKESELKQTINYLDDLNPETEPPKALPLHMQKKTPYNPSRSSDGLRIGSVTIDGIFKHWAKDGYSNSERLLQLHLEDGFPELLVRTIGANIGSVVLGYQIDSEPIQTVTFDVLKSGQLNTPIFQFSKYGTSRTIGSHIIRIKTGYYSGRDITTGDQISWSSETVFPVEII